MSLNDISYCKLPLTHILSKLSNSSSVSDLPTVSF